MLTFLRVKWKKKKKIKNVIIIIIFKNDKVTI